MASEVKVKVLAVKSLTCYVVKEEESCEAKQLSKLEDHLFKTYSVSEVTPPKQELDIGSYVCVLTTLGEKRAPKKWVRAVVRNVFVSVGTYLFDVYLLDHGLQRMVRRVDVRELHTQFMSEFVAFQAVSFSLADVRTKDTAETANTVNAVVDNIFKANDYLVWAQVRRRSKTNRIGLIRLNDGSDLGQVLCDRGLVVSEREPEDLYIGDTTIRKPKTSPLFKTAIQPIPRPPPDNCEAKPKAKRDLFELNGVKAKNSVSSESSLSSVSSVELSVKSDSSVVDIEEEDYTLNFTTQSVAPNKGVISAQTKPATNGYVKNRRQKYQDMLARQSLAKGSASETNGSDSGHSTDKSEQKIQYVSHYDLKNEEIDWPVEPIGDQMSRPKMRPAGWQPPPELIERIYTLKINKNSFDD